MAKKIGAHADEFGHLLLNEVQFVNAMLGDQIENLLTDMNIANKTSKFRHKSSKSSTQQTHHLNDNDDLVKWTLRSMLVANSLSGAVIMLLLAHTPVSRKVFQYFHCHEIAGREFLRADYDIDCKSNEYYMYMPFVVVVLVCFTIMLPVVILFYLFRHRKDLYSTRIHQRIGWLYDPFVRGAEFWQVHDLLIKMLLTASLFLQPFDCSLCFN